MATINTVFTLTDNFTPTLNKVNNSLDTTLLRMIRINHAIALFNNFRNAIGRVVSSVDDLYQAYANQVEQEQKLATIMRQRLNASNQEIESIKNFAKEQEELGVYSDAMILKGAQEIASFVTEKEEIEALIPALGHLVAQQYGYKASAEQVRNAATMMGRVLSGKVGGLSRIGYIFDETQEKILKTGTAMQKASMLAQVIVQNVGEMNYALKNTSMGEIMQMRNHLENIKEEAGKASEALKLLSERTVISFQIKGIELYMEALEYVKTHVREVGNAILVLGTIVTAVAAGMAIAWAVANWPITLAIGIVVIFIKVINDLGVSIQQTAAMISVAFQIVYGIIYDFVSIAYNAIILVINELIAFWNFCATLVESIVNLFTHPVVAFKQFISGLVSLILEVLEPLFGFIDMVFGSNLVKDIRAGVETARNWANQESNIKIEKKESIENDYKPFTVDKINGLEYAKGYQWNAELGKTIGTNLENGLKFIGTEIKYPEIPYGANGAISVIDGDLLEVAKDYRELLSKRAVEKFNLQFSQVTPSINIDNVVVNKEADAQNVLDMVANALDECANSSLSTN